MLSNLNSLQFQALWIFILFVSYIPNKFGQIMIVENPQTIQ